MMMIIIVMNLLMVVLIGNFPSRSGKRHHPGGCARLRGEGGGVDAAKGVTGGADMKLCVNGINNKFSD